MLFWLLVIFAGIPGSYPLAQSGICTKVRYYSVTVQKTHTVLKKFTYKKWNGRTGIEFRPVAESYTTSEYRTKTGDVCCHGYTLLRGKCVPLCDRVCENSECTGPNTCTCHNGYEKFNNFRCIPHCEKCVHGSCTAPGRCECYGGYENNGDNVCVPQCQPPCKNGICTLPDTCECSEGFELSPNSTFHCLPVCSPPCETLIERSECTAPNTCTCPKGYAPEDGKCTPVCSDCNNGKCIAPEECQCYEGYEKISNVGCVLQCEKDCENGVCSGPQNCTCFPGYENDPANWYRCTPSCEACDNGDCVAPEVCKCWEGFEQIENGLCVPTCSQPCENGNCTGRDSCACLEGYEPSPNNTYSCLPACDQCEYGDCLEPGNCTCWEGYEWNDLFGGCEYVEEELGDLTQPNSTTYVGLANETCDPLCINSFCENGFCHCHVGYSPVEESSNECASDCEATCMNGICDKHNFCICLEGYTRIEGACVSQCAVECVNGFCIEPNVCECTDGYILDYNQTNANYCLPLCDSYEDGCANGTCIGPDLCKCHEGFQLSSESKFVCVLADRVSTYPMESSMWLVYLCIAISLLALCGFVYYLRGKFGEKAYDVDRKERDGVVKYDKNGEKVAVI